MPLIKKPVEMKEKKQIRVRLDADLIDELNAYTKWAELPTMDYFFDQVIRMFFKKDKDWRNCKNDSTQSSSNVTQKNILAEEN